MHTIFFIVGKSGSGKDSLVSKICEECGFKQLKSYATRPKRINEGNTHTFINPDEVINYKDQMVAYTKIGEYEYFSTKQQLQESDFYVIDYRGIEYMHNLHIANDLNIKFITIYIHIPDSIREERATKYRQDRSEVFYKRCFNEDEQFNEMLLREDYDYSIVNKDFDKAYNIFKYIVKQEMNN